MSKKPLTVAEKAARAAHEVNTRFCLDIGDMTIGWDAMTPAMQQGCIHGAELALEGKTPRDLHSAWSESRIAEGWKHGPAKDFAAKTHPCLVPYDELPPLQRAKDELFSSIVRIYAAALGWSPTPTE